MSTPDTAPGARARPGRPWADALAFIVVPVALAGVFVAVLVGERSAVELDLQLQAPYSVPPGGALAIRAIVYDIGRDDGPPVRVVTPVELRLEREESLERVAHVQLEPTAGQASEGVLEVPPGVEGELRLNAEVTMSDGRYATVLRPLRVEAPARPFGELGRSMHPLRRYTPFPTQVEGPEPPSALDLRVAGGACVPEQPCELLVRVGDPAASVALSPSSALEVGAPEPPGPTAGIVRFRTVVHGPESEAEVVASREGTVVARRRYRLPVLLGGISSSVEEVIARAPAAPRLRFGGVEAGRPIVVDAFRDGVWERTGTVPAEGLAGPVDLPFAPLGAGLWRLQARTEGSDVSSSAVRFVWVVEGDDDLRSALASLAAHVRGLDWDDPYARVASTAGDDPETAAAFMLALPELDVRPSPPSSSGRVQAGLGLTERRTHLRWGGGLAFLLAGLFVAVMVLRRGLGAAAQARQLMAEAGATDVGDKRQRMRMTLTVVAIVAAVALAFVAAALMLLARG